jgi:ABC-type nitrate/sulfonate/bicarbonate transport system substrate-binding protein
MRRREFIAGLVGAALETPLAALGQNLEPVSVIVFPGGFNWPIWVAQEKGYFAKGGIEVKLTPTPNSVFQLTGLIEGKFDIAATAIDNVIAYMEG